MSEHRLQSVQLDAATLPSATAEIEHERRVAIFDLVETNSFRPAEAEGGPYDLKLSLQDNRLVFDITSGPVANNDVFILCSDGLTGEVNDAVIAEILKANPEPGDCVEQLVQKALDNGGGDNISIIAVKVEKKKPGFFRKLFNW